MMISVERKLGFYIDESLLVLAIMMIAACFTCNCFDYLKIIGELFNFLLRVLVLVIRVYPNLNKIGD